MKLIRIALVFGLLSAWTAPLFARSKPLAPSVDPDYILALATADRFLHAWQTQDEEAGILLLSDRIRQRTQEDRVPRFFSYSVSARSSYEIVAARNSLPAATNFQCPSSSLRPETGTRGCAR